MNRRLAVAVATMLAALPLSGLSAAQPHTLDGQAKTSHSYSGELAGPSVYAGLVQPEVGAGVKPTPRWCQEQTCDKTQLTLALPRGRQSGRLVVDLQHAPGTRMHLGVYDEKMNEIPPQDVMCCDQDRLVAAQLPPGRYLVVVYDDAGAGWFEIAVSWKANRPHRTPSRNQG